MLDKAIFFLYCTQFHPWSTCVKWYESETSNRTFLSWLVSGEVARVQSSSIKLSSTMSCTGYKEPPPWKLTLTTINSHSDLQGCIDPVRQQLDPPITHNLPMNKSARTTLYCFWSLHSYEVYFHGIPWAYDGTYKAIGCWGMRTWREKQYFLWWWMEMDSRSLKEDFCQDDHQKRCVFSVIFQNVMNTILHSIWCPWKLFHLKGFLLFRGHAHVIA